MEILHQHQQSQIAEGSPICDIWDGLIWRCFTGNRNINDPSLMCILGALAFSIYMDWFNSPQKSTQLASIGPILPLCLNFPQVKYSSQRMSRLQESSLVQNATHQAA
ncbi:hypothetical protein O181_092510 [Austropuccinia psidii MF-1]|uniref:Uncharacterized protein n=1 Tax=Austropuccinia psidii MF-1 TaxID=1389203 RepID=A0A9Q3IYQ2_9BASI|nr:hypothetical protein [Austropuccinia psidii MF-1]